ncbi:MAG: SpoIIE family protein phosphatase [Bacteroidales bacterium]|nr:SpoIIE family protein phosphatase [Bacteroidales bacterium]
MSSTFSKYPFVKKELLKIFIAISALLLVSVIYYFHIRKEALHTAQMRAEAMLKTTERIITSRMGKIEIAVNTMQSMAEYALDDPDAMFEIAGYITDANQRIMGAGIAFKEDYYPEKGHWYETYVGYQNGSDTLVSRQIGSAEHDYFQMDWFKQGMAAKEGFWSNPYFDNAGGKTYMISYCCPIFDTANEAVGVICTDVSLDTLAGIVQGMSLYSHSYCTLISGDGTLLIPQPESAKKMGKKHVFTEEIDGKNMTMTIIIPDADMYRRLRLSSLFFALVALTGIFTVAFIAHRLVRNLLKLNEIQIKEQHIEDELAIASTIQQALLPSGKLNPSIHSIDIKGLQIPAKFVGGDLYDYYVRDNKLLFCVGDVSGKGVPAALLMTISHSLFRTVSAREDHPEQIMETLNSSISDNNPDIMFITMFLGVMDLSTGTIRYCNAGHNPPIVIRNGQAELLSTEPSLLLGVEMNAQYTANELTLLPGDTLFLYTDGLTEAENIRKELFGERRALETAAISGALTASEQMERMQQAVHTFVDGAEQSDDLTMLVIRFMGNDNTLCMSNDIEELNKLEPFLNGIFEREHLDMSMLPQIDLALEEAVTNIIMYAYPEGEKGTAELTVEVADGQISATLIDSGTPFNPLQQQEANLDVSLEERKIGGLGIHLIKEIMDVVEYAYEDGRNVLKMKKNGRGGERHESTAY